MAREGGSQIAQKPCGTDTFCYVRGRGGGRLRRAAYRVHGDEMSGRLGRHVIGRYGVGTLWCVRAPDAFFIQFNAIKIAKRPLKGDAWIALEDGWKVTPYADGQIRVQLRNSEGVVVSLNGDVGK
jgi:hypothetical protein